MPKTKLQLEDELLRRDLKDGIIKEGDTRWASKLTEVIVYALCGLILTGAVITILATIYVSHPK